MDVSTSSLNDKEIIDLLVNSKNWFIVSGAGLSKASGIPTFRDIDDGIYNGIKPEDIVSVDADPKIMSEFCKKRFSKMHLYKPNSGHIACSDFESYKNIIHVTQNVDGLLLDAGCIHVIEIHGTVRKWSCIDCGKGINHLKILSCPHCDSELVRPNVVLFGEDLAVSQDKYDDIRNAITNADLLLNIGTQGVVQPVASFPYIAQFNNIPVIAINPNEPENYYTYWIQGKAEEVLPQIVEILSKI
jgi:NAD-dependent deacetylase